MTRLLTQSSMNDYKTCRKMAELKHERLIAPKTTDRARSLGSAVHKGLELFFTGKDRDVIITETNKLCVDKDMSWRAIAMITAYMAKYSNDSSRFDVVSVEHEFRLPLHGNHEFERGGKIDALVRKKDDGRLWLVEHKTAYRIDAAYISKLWIDFQIHWYAAAMEEVFKEPLAGVIYDVIQKPNIKQAIGETDDEWNARYAAAKNKKLLKRKMPEDDFDFIKRLEAVYLEPSALHREEIMFDRREVEKVIEEAAQLGEEWYEVQINKRWYRNTQSCFKWNKPCQYLPICQNHESQLIIDTQYEVGVANPELGAPQEEDTAF